jgi:tRNA1(Val) A37 N6-methylase TrmN6
VTTPTDDVFLGGQLSILQPTTGYRAGLDAVLLAACVTAAAGQSVLDAGAGVGVVGLSIAARIPGVAVTLLEREPDLAELARRNVERNALGARVRVVQADIAAPPATLSALGLHAGQFDHVVANPPYIASGQGSAPRDPIKAAAHVMPPGALDGWVRFLVRMVRDGGTVSIIHRSDALGDVLAALAGRFGAIDIRPVQPRAEAAAHRILVRGVKGSRRGLRLLPPFILHGPGGNAFLPAAEAVLRHGAAVPWPN